MRQFALRSTTIASLQAINAVLMIPLSFIFAVNEGVRFVLGGLQVTDGLGVPYAKALMLLILAVISLVASISSLFISLQMFQKEKPWTQLATLIAQGCIFGVEIAKVFVDITPNFISIAFAITIIVFLLIRLRIDRLIQKQTNNIEQSPQTANHRQ